MSGALQASQDEGHGSQKHVREEVQRSEEESGSEEPVSETDQENDSPLNKQQPTPPAEVQQETPSRTLTSAKRHQAITQEAETLASTRQLVKKSAQTDRWISNIIDMNHRGRDDCEPEKALSDCDDDEWAARLPSVLAQAGRNDQPKSNTKPSSNVVHWVTRGSSSAFLRHRASAVSNHHWLYYNGY